VFAENSGGHGVTGKGYMGHLGPSWELPLHLSRSAPAPTEPPVRVSGVGEVLQEASSLAQKDLLHLRLAQASFLWAIPLSPWLNDSSTLHWLQQGADEPIVPPSRQNSVVLGT